jgi:hypothetical protein
MLRCYSKIERINMSDIANEILSMCDYAEETENPATVILTSRLIAEIVQEDGLSFSLQSKRINGLRWFNVPKNILVITGDSVVITPRVYKQLVDMAEDITGRLRLQ